MTSIRVGIPKGYLFNESLKLFTDNGVEIPEISDRALIFSDTKGEYIFHILRPTDVPVYVEKGVVDLGICGMDIIKEADPKVTVLKDLGFGYCRLAIIGTEGQNIDLSANGLQVATKFSNSTRKFFADRGVRVDLLKLYGSVELAAATGLSDIVVDLVATGQTLKENKLVELETIYESTAHLVANPVFFSLHNDFIRSLLDL